jgi:hypothetical protein
MSKKSRIRLPKKIAGVKIPKSVRKGPVASFLRSPGGQVAIAEALIIAAGAFAARQSPDSPAGQLLRNPGESLKAAGRSTVRAKDSVARGSKKLSYAFAEAIKSFRAALQDEDIERTLANEAESLLDAGQSAATDHDAKKKQSPSEAVPPRYPSSPGNPLS